MSSATHSLLVMGLEGMGVQTTWQEKNSLANGYGKRRNETVRQKCYLSHSHSVGDGMRWDGTVGQIQEYQSHSQPVGYGVKCDDLGSDRDRHCHSQAVGCMMK